MLPPRTTGCDRVGGQERGRQRRGRRLALGAGDADGRAPTHRRRNRSGSETRAGAVESPAARAATSAWSAARRRGSVVGKSGLIDGEVVTSAAPAHVAGRVDVRSQGRSSTEPALEARDRVAELGLGAAVVDRHPGPGVDQEPGQGDPAPREPEDGHRAAGAAAPARMPSIVSPSGSMVGRRQASPSSLQPIQRRQEERHAEQGRQDADDPEADRDLLLVPAGEFEVVVDRAHPEEALAAGHLEVADLEDDRQRSRPRR